MNLFSQFNLTAQEQNKKLQQIFQNCHTLKCKQGEFQVELGNAKWFKTDKYKNNPYVNGDCSNSDSTPNCESKMVNIDEVLNIVAVILDWKEEKKTKHRPTLKNFILKCKSANVDSAELWDNVISSGFFGHALVSTNLVTERTHRPLLLAGQVAQLRLPSTLTLNQLNTYFSDYYKFGSVVLKVDDLFFKCQKEIYDKLPSCEKASTDVLIFNKTCEQKVNRVKFINQLAKCLFSYNSNKSEKNHPFWSTPTGLEWVKEGNLDCNNSVLDNTVNNNASVMETNTNPEPLPPFEWKDVFMVIKTIEPAISTNCDSNVLVTVDTNATNFNEDNNNNENEVKAGFKLPILSIHEIKDDIGRELKMIKEKVDEASVEVKSEGQSFVKKITQRYQKMRGSSTVKAGDPIENNINTVDTIIENKATELSSVLREMGNNSDAKLVDTVISEIKVISDEFKSLVKPIETVYQTIKTEVVQLIPHTAFQFPASQPLPEVKLDTHAAAFLNSVAKPTPFKIIKFYSKDYRHASKKV